MRIVTTILCLLVSFSALAKKETNYDECQNTVVKMFGGIFTIDEFGQLDPVKGVTEVPSFNADTGEYKFRLVKNKAEVLLNIKKDEQGRIYSIEDNSICIDCPRRLEFAYPKEQCLPKRVFRTNPEKQMVLESDLESCKNFNEIKNDLFKKMRKANKCIDVLKEYYQNATEVSKVMMSKLEESGHMQADVKEDLFAKLGAVVKSSEELKESPAEESKRSEKEEALKSSITEIETSCNNSFVKEFLNSRKYFKQNKNIYEIKKDKLGAVAKPIENSDGDAVIE